MITASISADHQKPLWAGTFGVPPVQWITNCHFLSCQCGIIWNLVKCQHYKTMPHSLTNVHTIKSNKSINKKTHTLPIPKQFGMWQTTSKIGLYRILRICLVHYNGHSNVIVILMV